MKQKKLHVNFTGKTSDNHSDSLDMSYGNMTGSSYASTSRSRAPTGEVEDSLYGSSSYNQRPIRAKPVYITEDVIRKVGWVCTAGCSEHIVSSCLILGLLFHWAVLCDQCLNFSIVLPHWKIIHLLHVYLFNLVSLLRKHCTCWLKWFELWCGKSNNTWACQ